VQWLFERRSAVPMQTELCKPPQAEAKEMPFEEVVL